MPLLSYDLVFGDGGDREVGRSQLFPVLLSLYSAPLPPPLSWNPKSCPGPHSHGSWFPRAPRSECHDPSNSLFPCLDFLARNGPLGLAEISCN